MSVESTGTAATESIEPQPVIDAENPWPGLDAFGEDAAAFFHGRDNEAAELARFVREAPLTVLFGKSGLGKTSLLQAGLFPRLRTEGVFPVHLRLAVREPGGPLVDQITTALFREAARRDVTVSPRGFEGTLWERLHLRTFAVWSPTNRPLVPLFVLDQFEEVFTLGAENRDAVERLRIDLADLIENRIPTPVVQRLESSPELSAAVDVRRQRYKVLLSFREDFLPDIEGWRTDLPSLLRNRFRLREMNAAQAFDAVYQTGAAARLVDERTARQIVEFVGKIQPDDRAGAGTVRAYDSRSPHSGDLAGHAVEPALLSLVCAELNKRRQQAVPPRPAIDADLLRGTAPSIISDFYLRQVARVPPGTRRFIEEELLTEGGYRSSFPVDEAIAQGVLTPDILRTLVDGRLLRIEHQLGVARVELTHDRLTDTVASEREKRRAQERSAGRRRALRAYAGVAAVALLLILFGALNWVAKTASEHERDEANRQRAIAESAVAQARVERDEAARQRAIAEAALQAMTKERERAEEQRLLAEQRQQEVVEEQEKARLAAEREQEAAERARAQAARAQRENAVVGELYAPVRPGVLRIEMQGRGMATAFLVTRTGLAVTPAHVLDSIGSRPLRARNFNNEDFGMAVVKLDMARDLALFRISAAGNTPCLPFAEAPPALGTPIVALSISPGQDWLATTGQVLALNVALGRKLAMGRERTAVADGDLIEVDLPAGGGFSGAPVMDPYTRGVVGMGAYGSAGEPPRHYLIPAARIRAAFAAELAGIACAAD